MVDPRFSLVKREVTDKQGEETGVIHVVLD